MLYIAVETDVKSGGGKNLLVVGTIAISYVRRYSIYLNHVICKIGKYSNTDIVQKNVFDM
jgi:hypothetical protein